MARSSTCAKCLGYVAYGPARAVCLNCGWQLDQPDAHPSDIAIQVKSDRQLVRRT